MTRDNDKLIDKQKEYDEALSRFMSQTPSYEELLCENERLKQMILDATKPQIFGTSSVVGIPEAAYNAMRDYQNKHLETHVHEYQYIGPGIIRSCRQCFQVESQTQNRVCQHYNMTVNGTCNDCGHKLTDEEWDSYPEGRPSKTSGDTNA